MSTRTAEAKRQHAIQTQAVPVLAVGLAGVSGMLSLSQSTVQDLVRKGQFPAPRQLAGRRVGWLFREVEAGLKALRAGLQAERGIS